jgi:hypothetical protein
MLNPSTADARADDATIRKCVALCRLWEFGELQVVNLFALRATDPRELAKTLDPVGPLNRAAVERAVSGSALVVCAWGTLGGYMRQDEAVFGSIKTSCEPKCLGVTQAGYPRHPLYVPYSTRLVPFLLR